MAKNEARITLIADDRASRVLGNVQRELIGMQGAAARLGGVIGPLGGLATAVAGLAAGTLAIKNFAVSIGDLGDAAAGLGTSALALAEMRSKAAEAGVEAGVLDNALGKLNNKIADAVGGNKQAVALFQSMGVAFKDVAGNARPTEQVLADIAERMRTYANTAEKAALLSGIFGERVGRRLAEYLSQGADGLRQFTGLTEQSIADAKRLDEQIDRLATTWERLKNAILGATVPAVNAAIESFNRAPLDNAYVLGKLQERLDEMTAAGITAGERIQVLRAEIARLKAEVADDSLTRFLAGGRESRRADALAIAPKPPGDDDEKKNSAAKSFLETLRKQAQAIGVTDLEAKRLEAAQLGVAKAAEPYIQRLEQAKALLADVARAIRQQEEEQKAATERAAFAFGLEERGRAMQFEADMIGRTRREVEQLTAAREIDAAVARENWKTDSDAAFAANEAAGERAKAIANRAIEARLVNEQQQAIDELLADIAEETLLIGASNAERARAALLRQLDAAGIDQQSDAYQELLKRLQLVADAIDFQDVVKRNIRGIEDLGDAIAGNVENAIVNFTNLRDLLNAIEQDILRIVTRQLVTEPLGKAISDILKGMAGPGGGIGNIFSQIGGYLFGGGKAAGGPVYGNVPYLVGERGPELFVPRSSGQIVNAQDTRRMAGATHITVNVAGSATRETANQVASAVQRRLAIAAARAF